MPPSESAEWPKGCPYDGCRSPDARPVTKTQIAGILGVSPGAIRKADHDGKGPEYVPNPHTYSGHPVVTCVCQLREYPAYWNYVRADSNRAWVRRVMGASPFPG